jgi:UDPglucose--hexose-1-phosphate uridylyltransferase
MLSIDLQESWGRCRGEFDAPTFAVDRVADGAHGASGEMDGAARYFQAHGRCILCDLVAHESHIGCRVIIERTSFIALAPFASRCPYEVWIIPKRHGAWFEQHDDGAGYRALAEVLREVLRRLNSRLDQPAYNIIWHSAPWIDACGQYYHWHIEILPRLTGIAGFEWGTGWYINSIPPEEAAEALRRVSMAASD